MNGIVKAFVKAFETAKKKNWDKIYVAVDLHETVMLPTWSTTLSSEYYPYAKETLQLMSKNPNICLILWSCSLLEVNKQYKEIFAKDGINFDYINENPECKSTSYADFETKLYFSVGLDDKFGFNEFKDWKKLLKYFNSLDENNNVKKSIFNIFKFKFFIEW